MLNATGLPLQDLVFGASVYFPPFFKAFAFGFVIRLVDSQKSFRTEDIEEVGDSRHNTFFEMLGNWSLGDYFKKEQLAWWLEFLFVDLKIDPARIYQTVYAGSEDGRIAKDEESIAVLRELFEKYGVSAEEGPMTTGKGALGSGQEIDFSRQRIFAYRDKNWWQRGDALGELGGPDSETFYDTGKKHNPKFGKFSILGNHDYGEYLDWKSQTEKQANFDGIKAIHDKIDFCREKVSVVPHIGFYCWSRDYDTPKLQPATSRFAQFLLAIR
jgi:alanyl-tRNA synthetase